MNERIKAAFERAAEIEECRRQGHVMESSLRESEMSEHGYVGWGNKIHLIKERWQGDWLYGDALCGLGGYIGSTLEPVDCKLCLRYMAKAKLEKDAQSDQSLQVKEETPR